MRRAVLALCALLAAATPAVADDGKPAHNLDGVRTTRYAWRGTLTGTTLDRQLSGGRTHPIPQDCQDGSTCSIEAFGLYTPPRLAARRTGELTIWMTLGSRMVRTAVAVYDARGREVFYEELSPKGTSATRFEHRFSKLRVGYYQVVLYGIASADSYSAELRWVLR